MIEKLEAVVKTALIKKYIFAEKIQKASQNNSPELYQLLCEYNEWFYEVSNQISEICQPLILSDKRTEWVLGCKLSEKYRNIFLKQRTEAEKLSSRLCLEYEL